MNAFEIYPAIDLRRGQVVRLAQGDPSRQTLYDEDPARVAGRFIDEGAQWIHLVNLDGALGEAAGESWRAVERVLVAASARGTRVQLGGGLRTLAEIQRVLSAGASRVVLGTAAVEQPTLVKEALDLFGSERLAVGLDAEQGRLRVRGWAKEAGRELLELGQELGEAGVATLIYTDIARDGVRSGVDAVGARQLAAKTGLQVIASGGVASLEDVRQVRAAALAGVIIGRALYEGLFTLAEALAC